MPNTPIVRADFRLVAGDQWQLVLPVYSGSLVNPVSLAGYVARFSLRQNFGDATSLIALSSAVSTAQGNITLTAPAGSAVPNIVTVTVLPAATVLGGPGGLPAPMAQQRNARFFYRVWLQDTSNVPTTICSGSWYVEAAA